MAQHRIFIPHFPVCNIFYIEQSSITKTKVRTSNHFCSKLFTIYSNIHEKKVSLEKYDFFLFQMSTLRITVAIFCNIISLKQIHSAPIIPLSLSFGKLPQLSIEDTNASIGPGLGGSPILVYTRPYNYNRYLF